MLIQMGDNTSAHRNFLSSYQKIVYENESIVYIRYSLDINF
jgi:hypothetical protein